METGMKHRKKRGGGKSNPVGADRFLGEQCYLCLPLHTHTHTHVQTHTHRYTLKCAHLVIERANKSLWRSTCIRSLYFTTKKHSKGGATDLQRTRTGPKQKHSGTRCRIQICVACACVCMCVCLSVCFCMSECACWLWIRNVGLFTFHAAWGRVVRKEVNRGKPEIAALENLRQVRFKLRRKSGKEEMFERYLIH